jgi:hypothetical protein
MLVMQAMGKWILRRIRGTIEMLLLVPGGDSAEGKFEYVCSECQETGAKSGIPRIPFSHLKIEKKAAAAGSYKTVFRAKLQVIMAPLKFLARNRSLCVIAARSHVLFFHSSSVRKSTLAAYYEFSFCCDQNLPNITLLLKK